MAKKLNVRTDSNVHSRKNPHVTDGQEYVEASHLDVLITLPFGAVLLASALKRLQAAGSEDLPATPDEVFNAMKRQCRVFIFDSVRTAEKSLSAKELAMSQSALVACGFTKPVTPSAK